MSTDTNTHQSQSSPLPVPDPPQKGNTLMRRIVIGAVGALALLVVLLINVIAPPASGQNVSTEVFHAFPQQEVAIADIGTPTYSDGLKAFLKEKEGVLGVHTYDEKEEGQTYIYLSGKKGMEPLTILLHGLVQEDAHTLSVGYSFIEASAPFQDDIPSLLLVVDTTEGMRIVGTHLTDENSGDVSAADKQTHDAPSAGKRAPASTID